MSRTDPTSKDSVLHTVEIILGNNDVECPTYYFLFFPVITIAEQADACCYIQVNNIPSDGKEQNWDCVDEGREVCIIDPTLQVTQPKTKERIQDIFHGLLNNVSLKEPVRMNIRQRHKWKDV